MTSPLSPALPWVESPFFEEELAARDLSPDDAEKARFYHRHGYLLLEDLFDDALIDAVRAEVEPLFASPGEEPRRSGRRFQDAWRESAAARRLATHPGLTRLLSVLYERRPFPFQTLHFSHGSEQRPHADTVHFDSWPPRFMCGVWVALEDVGPENGTLVYYPGSQRLPDYAFDELGLRFLNHNRLDALEGETYAGYERYEDFVERLMATHGLERRLLSVAKGTALIWSAGLVHGGAPVERPGATRWSQVTHVYFDDCVYYSPVYSNPSLGDLYLKRVVDVGSGEPVGHVYRGLPLPAIERDGAYKLMLDVEDGRDVVRLFSNRQLKHLADENRRLREEDVPNLRRAQANLEAAIRNIEASPSLRLGRALTAPLRWLRGRRK